MGGSATTFGVNFADGRIKGYGREHPGGGEMTQFVRYVRGNPDYGQNQFVENGDGTLTDLATGLMWMQSDSGSGMDWQAALGTMHNAWIDVHGAGAQRGDPKSGDPAEYPSGRGPQGDAIRIYNFVRAVRDVDGAEPDPIEPEPETTCTRFFPLVVDHGSASQEAGESGSLDVDALGGQPATGRDRRGTPAGEGLPLAGGRIVSKAGNTIQAENPQGAFTIVTSAATEVRLDKSPGGLSDVAVGKFVGASGQVQADGTVMSTIVIVSESPPPGAPPPGGASGPG
jgi:hypothetical protein